MKLSTQMHLANPGWDAKLQSFSAIKRTMRSEEVWFTLPNKPFCTLWTSSLEENTSAWLDFLGTDREDIKQDIYLYQVEDAKICVLESNQDFLDLLSSQDIELPKISNNPQINFISLLAARWHLYESFWRGVADDWDAVHVPRKHERNGLLTGWDCESTAWFNPHKNLTPIAAPQNTVKL